ncbi:MAG: alpha/beta hydrolase [Chryseotalea sp. WA131a]|nr:MAG: alpha/beta hydrolase [Chryseotalea sp. WA131a]
MSKINFLTALTTIIFIHFGDVTMAQVFGDNLNLVYGKHKVGFRNYKKDDNTRSYRRIYDWDNKVLARPISISIWYPTEKTSTKTILKVKNYMTILKQEEEWESLPDERILSWFYYSDNEHNRGQLELETKANFNTRLITGKFPMVIYAPSYQASSVENFALCEFLASHGYIVLSCPSRGTENRFLDGGTTRDIETQASDIEFLIGEASTLVNADLDKLSVIGFSFGGISNVLAQMKNERIKALVCLDGSIKYQFEKILTSSYANLSRVNVPFIFMSQKDIPLPVMIADKIDTTLNKRFDFYDSLKHSQAYYLKFNDLTHSYFSSMGVLFQDRGPRQDKSDKEIISSYGWMTNYTLHFLNAFLKNDKLSKQFLDNDPTSNGVPGNSITIKSKIPTKRSLSFQDFNVAAQEQDYKDLEGLVKTLKRNNTDFELQEWKLNNLGLQLLFKGKVQEGVNILSLNTILYPNSANGFDSLAEGYLVQGNNELAKKNFNLSLKLDPQNQNAIEKLRKLGQK